MTDLRIPEGINYECTGCGNCCLEWPVPATAEDQARISVLAGSFQQGRLDPGRLFRKLGSNDAKLKSFTHTLEKRADGRCEFLTEDNRCWLHLNFGAEAKPAMCRLFPYTFTRTPSGVYASVSFASTGALLNSGRPLTEQREFLQDRWALFQRLYPSVTSDWSQTQLVDGQPLAWDDYLVIEEDLMTAVRARGGKGVERRLFRQVPEVLKRLPPGCNLERLPKMEARPRVVDQLLLKELLRLYLPDDPFASGASDLDAQALLKQLVAPPPAVRLASAGASYGFQQLRDFLLGELDEGLDDLLSRYIYCRIFSKLYFGNGLAGLSLLAGLHHLLFLLVIVRLKIKMTLLREGRDCLSMLELAEMVRTLERRLTQVSFSRESSAVLEVLLLSPERAERALLLAA